MNQLKFKIFEKYSDDMEVVPLGLPLLKDKTSELVAISSNNAFTADYIELENVSTDLYRIPFQYTTDLTAYISHLTKAVLLAKDDLYTLTFSTSNPGTNLRLEYINGEEIAPEYYNVSYDIDKIIIQFRDDILLKNAIYAVYDMASVVNYRELISQPQPIYSGFTLNYNNGYLEIDISGTSLSGTTEKIYFKQNSLTLPNVYIPKRDWTQEWNAVINDYAVIGEKVYINTLIPKNAPYTYSHIASGKRLSSRLIKCDHRNINSSKALIFYVNGIDFTSHIQSIDYFHGIIQTDVDISPNDTIEIRYSIDYSKNFILEHIDFNPQHIFAIEINTLLESETQTLTVYIPPVNVQTRPYFSLSNQSSLLYAWDDLANLSLSSSLVKIGTATYSPMVLEDLIDLRRIGGGLKEEYKDQVNTFNFTDFGVFDGIVIDNHGILIRIPQSAFDRLAESFADFEDPISEADKYIRTQVEKYLPVGMPYIIEYKAGV